MSIFRSFVFLLAILSFSCLFSQTRLNVIIDADTGNEVDDPFALARALLYPEWNILSLNAAHWQTSHWAVEQSMENSHRLNQVILGYMGRNDIKTRRGAADRLYDWGDLIQHSAAAYEIVKQAKAVAPGEKLTVIALGALTNVASAILLAPEIEPLLELHWLGTTYDFESAILRTNDFNCVMDISALDYILFSDVELHITPINVAWNLEFDLAEVKQELEGLDPLCNFLIRRWEDHLDGGKKKRVIWDLALITGMIHPEWVKKEKITTSRDNGNKEIYMVRTFDSEKIRTDFYNTLKSAYSKKD